MTQRPRVGVVIVNYASTLHLERLLASLRGEHASSILVWDNYSSDVEHAKLSRIQEKYPEAFFHLSSRNLGFGAAVNESVRLLRLSGHFDYYWLLNPDILVRRGTLDQLLDGAQKHGCAVISPKILITGTDRIWYSGGRLDIRSGRSIHEGIGELDSGSEGFSWVSFVSGAAPLIESTAWHHMGGFDERFFLYCEDAALSWRAAELGVSLGVDRRAIVEHAEGGSSGGGVAKSPTFYYYVQRNRLLLYGKRSRRAALLFGPGALETMRLILFTLKPLDRQALTRLAASLSGLVAGLLGESGMCSDQGLTRFATPIASFFTRKIAGGRRC